MEIINAKIHVDLCACAIEEGLNTLKSKDINKVFLLTATRYDKFLLNLIHIHRFQLDDFANKIIFPPDNVATSKTLIKDSWMLIDYVSNQIYYSKGA